MSQSSRMSTSDVEHYQEELEPGQLRLEDMLKKPQSKNQAVLYKMISPIIGRGKTARKQTLEPRASLSNDEDIGESSGQDEVVAIDSDQASTSGTQFVVPKTPAKPRGKRQPAAVAAAAAAKKRAADDAKIATSKKATQPKPKPVKVTIQDEDDESDEDNNHPSGNDDGDDSETQRSQPPVKKPRRSYTARAPKDVKRSPSLKGAKAVAKAFDDNMEDEDVEIIDVSGPPVEERKAFKLRISPAGDKDGLFLCHVKYEKNGMFYLGLRRINASSGYKTWLRIKPEEIAGLEKGIAVARKKMSI